MTSPTTLRKLITHLNWREFAKCAGNEALGEAFFDPTEANQEEAASFCRDCPTKLECLAEALDTHPKPGIRDRRKPPVSGVWGGMTKKQRTFYLRKYYVPWPHKTWMEYARAIRERRNAAES